MNNEENRIPFDLQKLPFFIEHTQFIKNILSSNPNLSGEVKELIEAYANHLKSLKDQIIKANEIIHSDSQKKSKFRNFIQKRKENRELRKANYPTSVNLLHTGITLAFCASAALVLALSTGFLLTGNIYPSMWAPQATNIIYTTSISTASVGSIAFRLFGLERKYDINNPPFGTRRMSNRARLKYEKLQRQRNEGKTIAHMAKNNYLVFINTLLNSEENNFLNEKGHLSNAFDYLSTNDREQLASSLLGIHQTKELIISMQDSIQNYVKLERTMNEQSATPTQQTTSANESSNITRQTGSR